MLFDGIVYALFGKASTEGRNEELRSHFADGKSPMSVEYEFKINDKNLKYLDRLDLLKRNTSLTPGKLDVLNLMKKVSFTNYERVKSALVMVLSKIC